MVLGVLCGILGFCVYVVVPTSCFVWHKGVFKHEDARGVSEYGCIYVLR